MGRFLPWTDYPVYRFPADIIHWGNDSQQFVGRSPYNEETLLFDIESDYAQEHPLHDEALERHCIEQMKRAWRHTTHCRSSTNVWVSDKTG